MHIASKTKRTPVSWQFSLTYTQHDKSLYPTRAKIARDF